MDKIKFDGYSDYQKRIIQDVLMFSPKCWVDGKFKYDRNKSDSKTCNNRNCFECMFDHFDLATK